MSEWTQKEAGAICRQFEKVAPEFGAHVALTGGLLYKDGPRKDCDILFYCIRQWDAIDEEGLLAALERLGLVIVQQYGWVRKAKWFGKDVDLFFPEAYPASATRTNGQGDPY